MSLAALWSFAFYFWAAFEVWIALSTRARSPGDIKDKGSLPLLWIAIVVSVTACQFLMHLPTHYNLPFQSALLPLALLAMASGLAIRWTAIRTLGKAFTANVAIQANQTICRRGLYSVVRHPSYLGLLLIFLSVGLRTRGWLGLAIAVVPTTAALLYRISVEERALRDAFGPEYEAYARDTKRLAPGIY